MEENEISAVRERLRKFASGRNSAYQSRFQTSDVIQDALVQIISTANRQKLTVTNAWLKLLVSGNAANLRRHHDAKCRSKSAETGIDVLPPADLPRPEKIASTNEDLERLTICLAKLPANEKKVVSQFALNGTPFHEIAKSLNCSQRTARNYYHKGLANLKRMMSEADE